MEKLIVKVTSVSNNGHRINYDYTLTAGIKKYFNQDKPFYIEFQEDISSVPESILAIPLVANLAPIAWYAGFNIEIEELDEDFNKALQVIKQDFLKRESVNELKGDILPKKVVQNTFEKSKTAMLFSGGVDAYATYIRIFDKTPDLITLLGADIQIEDQKQWTDFTNFVESEGLLKNNDKEYITANLRDFYTYQVELLLTDIGWWGKVQHGLALIGALAPLSYVKGYKEIYIASSYTDNINIEWGSTPQIDEAITWANGVQVYHDGYDLKRQDKVDLIADFAEKADTKFKLRVCYSEKRTEFNCSYCEKCFRTIFGLILNNKNPNDYGFNVDGSVYDKMYTIFNIGSGSKGVRYFWWELMEKAKSVDQFYVFSDEEAERKQIDKIRSGSIDQLLEQKLNTPKSKSQRLKFIIRNKFPWLRNMYRKIK